MFAIIEVDKGEDTVHVYKDGYKIEYFGVRDPDTFIQWLLNIPDDALTIINDKDDLKSWEKLEDTSTRLVGYFEPGSKALKEFEEAAEDFMGEVEFYAVVDTTWARKVGLRKVGEVHMYRPYEDDPVVLPSSVDTEEEFEDWVEKHKDPIMQKLSLDNYFNVWKDPEQDEFLIVAFANDESQDGKAVFKLLKKLTAENREHAGSLEIVFIDPDEFPLMIDVWEEMFGIEIEAGPVIGHVDISEREGIWFDMSQLNLKNPKKYAAENLEVLDRWVDQIIDGTISLKGGPDWCEKTNYVKLLLSTSQRRDRFRHNHTKWRRHTEWERLSRTVFLRKLLRRNNDLQTAVTILQERLAMLQREQKTPCMVVEGHLVLSRHSEVGHISDNELSPNLIKSAESSFASDQAAASLNHKDIQVKLRRISRRPRRCRLRHLKDCNAIEYHIRTNPIVAYFVMAGLIALMRAMRITVGFYICPVIDDFRDRLRANNVPLV